MEADISPIYGQRVETVNIKITEAKTGNHRFAEERFGADFLESFIP